MHELPSITELGRMLGAIIQREAAVDLVNLDRGEPANEEERREWLSEDRRLMTADRLLFSRIEALRRLIASVPALTLSDCAVQISVAGAMICTITSSDLEKTETKELADAIERIMISVMPVLAAAAGLDLAEFGFDELTDLHEGRFPELAA